jgi:hypothetical protein
LSRGTRTLVALVSLCARGAAADPWALPPEGSCESAVVGDSSAPLEDVAPAPLAPGSVIDAESARRLRGWLPEAIWAERERFLYEGMALEIGPCFRDYAPPAHFAAATERFRGRATLLDDGGLAGHVAGLPFAPDAIDPADPRAGERWAWDAVSRWQAGGFRGRFRVVDLVGRIGRAEPFEGEIWKLELAHRADREADGWRVPGTEPFRWVVGGRFRMPQNARDFAWLQFRDVASASEPARSDDLHAWMPSLRKVRRLPAHGIEGIFVPTFSVGVSIQQTSSAAVEGGASIGTIDAGATPDSLEPKRSGFEGLELRPQRWRFRVARVQDVLAPLNAAKPAYPAEPDRDFGPYGLSWASDRWDLRRALLLEGTLRETDATSEVSRLSLWLDLQTLHPLYWVSYDARREPIDVGYFVGRWSEDRPDYPRGTGGEPARVIDSVGEAFANLKLKGSWRRESWDLVSAPEPDKDVRRALSINNLNKGR